MPYTPVLATLGYESVFLDFDPTGGLVPGQAWRDQLFTNLDACDAVVFLTTPTSVASQWCHSELALTRWLRKPILALLVDGSDPHPLTADLQGLKVTSDHIDRDPLNNRRSNLRVVTFAQNAQNVGPNKNSSSRYRGVYKEPRRLRKRWLARVRWDGRHRYCGRYETEIEAARAAEACRRYHFPFSTPDLSLGADLGPCPCTDCRSAIGS